MDGWSVSVEQRPITTEWKLNIGKLHVRFVPACHVWRHPTHYLRVRSNHDDVVYQWFVLWAIVTWWKKAWFR